MKFFKFYPLCPKDDEGNYVFAGFAPDSKITKTPKYRTDYTYNTYGQNVSVTSYPAAASGTSVIQKTGSKKMVSAYEYQTTSGSRIFGALLSETDSTGRTIRYYYDSNTGFLLASINVTDGNGTAYTYDDFGNLVTVMPATYISDYAYTNDINAENVTYTYDEHNRLSTVVTDSTTYTFAYDVFGNSSSIGVGTNTLASYEYNSNNGKLKKLNYANGTSVEYKYNDLDNVSEIWYTVGENDAELAYSYTYTAKGQLHSLEDHINDRTTIYEYDQNGKVTKMLEYDSEDMTNLYESRVNYSVVTGLVNGAYYKLAYTKGTAKYDASWNYGYSYNEDQTVQMIEVSTPAADGEITYTYDDFYRLSGKTYAYNTDSDSADEFTNTTTYTYKKYGDNTGIEVDTYATRINNNAVYKYTYTYDESGNIIQISGNEGSEYRYVYDDRGQLIREDNSKLNKTYTYTYDNAGNITSKKTYAYTSASSSPSSLSATYTYGYGDSTWGDKLTSYRGVNFTYDELGNPLTYYNGTSYNFTWVQGRRLETVTKSGQTYTYTYNADGIRTSKTINGVTREYILNGTQILGETWSDGTTIVYIYDAEGSAIGMLYRTIDYAENEFDIFFYEHNLQGDVIAVYNASGTKLISYAYDAWGNVTTTYYNGGTSTGAQYNPFTYRGYYRDSETGFYYLNSRYYDPVTARFIQSASLSSLNSHSINGLNLYGYLSNNPIAISKPTNEAHTTSLNGSMMTQTVPSLNKFTSGVSAGSKNYWNPHWENTFFAGGEPGFLVATNSGFQVINIGYSVYKGSLFLDNDENHSVNIAGLNIAGYVGWDVEHGVGLDLSASVLDIGYDGQVIDAGVSFLTAGVKVVYQNGKFESKIGLGWFGWSISIDFYELYMIVRGEM